MVKKCKMCHCDFEGTPQKQYCPTCKIIARKMTMARSANKRYASHYKPIRTGRTAMAGPESLARICVAAAAAGMTYGQYVSYQNLREAAV